LSSRCINVCHQVAIFICPSAAYFFVIPKRSARNLLFVFVVVFAFVVVFVVAFAGIKPPASAGGSRASALLENQPRRQAHALLPQTKA
jgi:hypothetical protein